MFSLWGATGVLLAAVLVCSSVPAMQQAHASTGGTADLLRSCLIGENALVPVPIRVALVEPVFTETPYAHFNSSFYAFYLKHQSDKAPTTSDLGMLSTRLVSGWPNSTYNPERPLYKFLTSHLASACGLVLGKNLHVITDLDVNSGSLMSNGGSLSASRHYDVLILGHEEYVTAYEFAQFKQFVGSGGTIVEMSGNTFWAQVAYSPADKNETFVAGHGFQFDGHRAWRSDESPFNSSSASWFGSVFDFNDGYGITGAFVDNSTELGSRLGSALGRDLFTDYSYRHNEVNVVANFTNTEVIARFHTVDDLEIRGVSSYVHEYLSGQVVCLCVFGENLILRDVAAQYFLMAAVHLAIPLSRTVEAVGAPTFAMLDGTRGVFVNCTNFGLAPQEAQAFAVWTLRWGSQVSTIAVTGDEAAIAPYQQLIMFIPLIATQQASNYPLNAGALPTGNYSGKVAIFLNGGPAYFLQVVLPIENEREA